MTPRVSILIITARNAPRLERCLAAVRREAPPEVPLEIIVVLNAAGPELHAVVTRQDDVIGLESDIPLGLPGGVNLAAQAARGEFLHLLHDDTEVEPGWLAGLLAAAEAEPRAGVIGSVVLDFDGGVQTAGTVLWRDGETEVPPLVELELGMRHPVDYCASASVLIRRAAFAAIGGLDEELHPAYYVDVDLAIAMRAAGWAVLIEPASRVRHERGGSAGLPFRQFLTRRNRARILAKWPDELARQAPREPAEDRFRRARAATAARASALLAAPHPPATADAPGAGPEGELDRLRRERAHLLRDNAVKAAWIAELEAAQAELEAARQEAAVARHEAASLRAEREWRISLEAELQRAGPALAAADADRDAARRELAAVRDSRWFRLGERLRRLSRRAG